MVKEISNTNADYHVVLSERQSEQLISAVNLTQKNKDGIIFGSLHEFDGTVHLTAKFIPMKTAEKLSKIIDEHFENGGQEDAEKTNS